MQLPSNKQIVIIDTLPFLVELVYMTVYGSSILEILATWRALMNSIKAEVDFTNVSPHVIPPLITFSTKHANKATITSFNLALHQVIHRLMV